MLTRLRAVGLTRAAFTLQQKTFVPVLRSARSFATDKKGAAKETKGQPKPATEQKQTKAPVEVVDPLFKLPDGVRNAYGDAGKSATRLYNLAKQQKADLRAIKESLENFNKLVKRDPELVATIQVPTSAASKTGIDQKKKEDTILKAVKSLKMHPLAESTLLELIKERQDKVFRYLENVQAFLNELMVSERKEMPITIKSAQPLTKEQSKRLTQKLKEWAAPSGLTPVFTEVVDDKLVGGLVVTAGEQYVDLSVSSRLRQLEKVFAKEAANVAAAKLAKASA